MDNQTYQKAHRFFRKRDELGIKPPKPKKATANDQAQFDVSGVPLDGEQTESVPVYDDCNEVRRKINAHLKEPGVTQASFGREISKYFTDDSRKVQGKQIADFLKKKGESSGAESCVYYNSYIYFEKLRIKKGTKKGKKRTEAEARFPRGRELKDRKHEWVFMHTPTARRRGVRW